MTALAHLLTVSIENHTFLPRLLPSRPLVVDFGLNHGNFAMALIRQHGAEVHGAEPVPELYRTLPQDLSLHADPVAVGGRDGEAWLSLHEDRCASLEGVGGGADRRERVQVRSLRSFFAGHGITAVDLLKVDIEGAECDLFEMAEADDVLRCRQITVEFHDFMTPEIGPRVEAVKSRLVALGFHCIKFSLNNGDVLFVRRDVLSLGGALVLRWPVKLALGAHRRVSAWLRAR